jgi:hypothetical protein
VRKLGELNYDLLPKESRTDYCKTERVLQG